MAARLTYIWRSSRVARSFLLAMRGMFTLVGPYNRDVEVEIEQSSSREPSTEE